MNTTHLLIDAKNMLYRAVYTARSDEQFKKSGHHPANIVLHILTYYYERFKPEQVHMFWDSPRTNTWRRNLNPTYKDNRDGHDEEIVNGLANLTEIGMMLFANMGIRQYARSSMEADDLIYAFCKINQLDPTVICSSDSDLKQISYRFKNVNIHHPMSKNKSLLEPKPDIDPVTAKCLMGDKSDNIIGYHRVGKITAKKLVEDVDKFHEFFQSSKAIIMEGGQPTVVGSKRFLENLKMIDLSLCPDVLNNIEYVLEKQFKPVKFNLKTIRTLISKYKIRGITAGIPRYITPFKKLVREQTCQS